MGEWRGGADRKTIFFKLIFNTNLKQLKKIKKNFLYTILVEQPSKI